MDKKNQFNEIYNKHYNKVFRLCKGYFCGDIALASDAAQEIFIKVWENLDTFRNESSISTWIYKIAVNTCLLYLRKSFSRKEIRTVIMPQVVSDIYSNEKEEQLQQMYKCIQKLEETNKMIILMTLDGIEYNEISEVIGITEETLRVRIHRIKKTLTKCVQNEDI
ncbi:RNA polymerase sigma factor [Flavobacterium reichenbachii]|uniref:RNA polymerase sigma factor n=1 Tax=Flavobacterium reichenbachii TaxID=362418 RepID=A0A085ZPJ6_9FLAO|nr:sigma-70 family RNA polymerase sigma factor [Flavobacterium reichenbachii]KFF06360.1 RNA polymerase sigma factor [Flavobacterium reichenbachii]OXB17422.1 RNA polymerase subunit sigma [Flavobacterium reichenbachii]